MGDFVESTREASVADLKLAGCWTVFNLQTIRRALASVDVESASEVRIRCNGIEQFDLSGAWLLRDFALDLEARGIDTNIESLSNEQLRFVQELQALEERAPEKESPHSGELARRLEALGRGVVRQALDFLEFAGRTFLTFVVCLLPPTRLRLTPIVHHIEHSGIRAVPIVSLIGFLIAVVLTYQGANQLRTFGAEVFTVDLVAISILREMAVVLTAVVVAGRSGSAYAAELGVMRLNEEVDAMQVLGIDPLKTLVMPRVLALVVAMPLLTFIADVVGLLGAAILCNLFLDIPTALFLSRLQASVDMSTFLVGIVKAPVFGFLIAMVGCRRGLQVQGSASELGRLTTVAVVECIVLVILADAGFSVLFSELGI